eukprot:4575668-Amphidinium_carterae.2
MELGRGQLQLPRERQAMLLGIWLLGITKVWKSRPIKVSSLGHRHQLAFLGIDLIDPYNLVSAIPPLASLAVSFSIQWCCRVPE